MCCVVLLWLVNKTVTCYIYVEYQYGSISCTDVVVLNVTIIQHLKFLLQEEVKKIIDLLYCFHHIAYHIELLIDSFETLRRDLTNKVIRKFIRRDKIMLKAIYRGKYNFVRGVTWSQGSWNRRLFLIPYITRLTPAAYDLVIRNVIISYIVRLLRIT